MRCGSLHPPRRRVFFAASPSALQALPQPAEFRVEVVGCTPSLPAAGDAERPGPVALPR